MSPTTCLDPTRDSVEILALKFLFELTWLRSVLADPCIELSLQEAQSDPSPRLCSANGLAHCVTFYMLSTFVLTNAVDSLYLASRRLLAFRAQLPSKPCTAVRSISAASKMPLPPSDHRAPWRDLLDSHFSQAPDYDFAVATVGYDPQGRPVPRVRTCGCRGFFPEIELHPKGQEAMEQQVEESGNPNIYESDMLVFTTDVRMEKLGQLESAGHAVEAVFWLKDLMSQWRIKGTAFSVGDPRGEADEEEKLSRQEISKGLRLKENAEGDAKNWTWGKAVTKYFANHSPIMRGMSSSFACISAMLCQANRESRHLQGTSSRAA